MVDVAKQASKKRLKTREQLWPNAGPEVFDPSDRATKGYAQVPRVVPLVARLINEIGGAENAGSLYQVLWAQDWGQAIVEVRSFKGLLYEAGYNGKGSRVERTWAERIQILEQLGFIKTAARGLDNYGYILLINPYLAALRTASTHTAKPVVAQWLAQFRVFCEQWGIDLSAYETMLNDVSDKKAST